MACLRLWVPLVSLCALSRLSAQAPLFESRVEPLLKASCLPCHNERNRSSGLALDTREGVQTGGNRGPVLKPGAPADSLLVRAVEQKGDLKMPPAGRLKDEQIAAFASGSSRTPPWPDSAVTSKQKPGWDHWAFQRPKHADSARGEAVRLGCATRSTASSWPGWSSENVKPSPEADAIHCCAGSAWI